MSKGEGKKGKVRRKQDAAEDDSVDKTTVMIGHLPNQLDSDKLLEILDAQGFRYTYDFVYLPLDFNTQNNMGHAFVNFFNASSASKCIDKFKGFKDWPVSSQKASKTSYATCQGYENNLKSQQKSAVTARNVPDQYKPLIFDKNGNRKFIEDVVKVAASAPGWGGEWESSNSGWNSNSWSDQGWGNNWDANGWNSWQDWNASGGDRDAEASRNYRSEESAHEWEDKTSYPQLAPEPEKPLEPEPEVIPIFVALRYACIGCSERFAKWSACQKHVLSNEECRVAAGLPREIEEQQGYIDKEMLDALQNKCREKGEDLQKAPFALQ